MPASMLKREQPHVVILGGGFGGLAAAKALATVDVRITLIDRTNHHLFQPLLYQVATAALAAPDVSAPIRKLLWKQKNVTVWMANVTRIDVTRRRIVLEQGETGYDYLIVATGMTHAYFGYDQWAAHAPGLKTVGEALDVRRRILRAFENAELASSPDERRAWTTFVVIGAGPTGVELAGAIAEIAGRTLARDFRRFDPRTTRVVLVEAGPRVLPSFEPALSESARRQLEHLGIEVRVGSPVTDMGPDFVEVGGERVHARTTIWAAGVQASALTSQLGVPVDRAGRIWVEEDLSVPDRPEVFVVGDLIAKTQDGKPLPGVAQLAMQSGAQAARNILASVNGKPRTPFRYVDKGSMATIGRNKAVAQLGRFQFSGVFAWWLWLAIHVLFLVEFRSRVAVLFEWAWAYFTWSRRSRVILEVPRERSAHSLSMPPSIPIAARKVG
ncbi:MAG: NAD(P)/FAD-dependent oxidoreductase [Polyangiales bacterium]